MEVRVNRVKMTEELKWGEIQGKLDLVRVIGVLLYQFLKPICRHDRKWWQPAVQLNLLSLCNFHAKLPG